MPRVTVVVPAFNAAAFIAATLHSVLAGRHQDFEICVVDDGSTDGTAELASECGRNRGSSGKVRVLRQRNGGLSASRNCGIEQSDSEFVALLDHDDLWHPAKLDLQLAVLAAKPETGLCYSEFFPWNGLSQPVFAEDCDTALDESLSGWIYPKMLLTNFALPSSIVFRRSALHTLGPFLCDDHQTDDWEYTVRASRLFPFAKLAAPLVAYRQTPGSLSRRPRQENVTELMRDSLIARFGLTSPQGSSVDAAELARRRHKGWRDFAATHVTRGSLTTGTSAFGQLFWSGPHRANTALTLIKALGHRLIDRNR